MLDFKSIRVLCWRYLASRTANEVSNEQNEETPCTLLNLLNHFFYGTLIKMLTEYSDHDIIFML